MTNCALALLDGTRKEVKHARQKERDEDQLDTSYIEFDITLSDDDELGA